MTQQIINIGAAPNDGTGDQLRVSFDKCNQNFTELYTTGAATATEGIWNFNQTSTDTTTSPATGRFRTNSGNAATATQFAIHRISINGFDRADTLRTQHPGDIIKLQDKANADSWARFVVQAIPVDNVDWFQINVAFDSGGGTPPGNNQEILFTFAASSGGGGGGGNVNNVGTPTNGQLAQWTDATHIQGINATSLGYAPLASPTFTGDPKVPTPTAGDNDTSIASTAFVTTAIAGKADTSALAAKADLASPTFTGDPKAPTPLTADNDTSIATTAFVQANLGSYLTTAAAATAYQPLDGDLTAIAALTGTNTIYYRSAANTWSAVTVSTGLSFSSGSLSCTVSTVGFAPLASPVFTGDPQAPTPATADNDTSIATTAFVKAQGYVTGGPFQPLDGDLTAIAALTGINVIYYRSAADTWATVTIGTGLSFSSGTLSSTVSTAGFAPLASPVFTGDPQAPTPATADNDTSIATTAFVKAQGYVTGGPFQPLDADLTTLASLGNWKVVYSDGASAIQALSIGASGTVLTSNGTAAAPSFQTPAGGGSGFTTITPQVFTASGTYTPTAGMKYCVIEAVGGGGGGGGIGDTTGAPVGAGGGGSGGYSRKSASAATIGASQAVTIGAAGAAGTAGGGNGGNGGNTSVGTLCVANGGSGGGGHTAGVLRGGAGGITTGAVGDVVAAGNTGGGGSNGGASNIAGGHGGGSFFGGGGQGAAPAVAAGSAVGFAGNNYGAGGGGAAGAATSTTRAGGAGSPGYVIITEYI